MAAKKPVPVATETEAKALQPTAIETKELTETPAEKQVPEYVEKTKELPKDYNEANAIKLGDEVREIKSTKLRYMRSNTTIAYRILQMMPLVDMMSMGPGFIGNGDDRDGDQVLFDFLVAVFDDSKFVQKYYDEMTADDIYRVYEIFCRLNHISNKDEQGKNRAAKETKA